jgi:hypothetical protein
MFKLVALFIFSKCIAGDVNHIRMVPKESVTSTDNLETLSKYVVEDSMTAISVETSILKGLSKPDPLLEFTHSLEPLHGMDGVHLSTSAPQSYATFQTWTSNSGCSGTASSTSAFGIGVCYVAAGQTAGGNQPASKSSVQLVVTSSTVVTVNTYTSRNCSGIPTVSMFTTSACNANGYKNQVYNRRLDFLCAKQSMV